MPADLTLPPYDKLWFSDFYLILNTSPGRLTLIGDTSINLDINTSGHGLQADGIVILAKYREAPWSIGDKMGSLAADDRSFLEAALKHAHETYRERNALSMKSHHEVSSVRWTYMSRSHTDSLRHVDICLGATPGQCCIRPRSL